MKILLIDKTAVLEFVHQRYELLAAFPDCQVAVLSPRKWHEHMRLVPIERTSAPTYQIFSGRTFWTGSYSRGFYLTGLRRALREFQPDIIQLLEEPWSLFAGQTVALARRLTPQARVLFYTWENIYRQNTYCSRLDWLHRRVEKRTFTGCCSGVCATRLAAQVLQQRGFSGHTPVIPYGIQQQFVVSAEQIEAQASRPLHDPPVVGYIGRLLPMKGIDTLLQALAQTSCRLCLLGAGSAEPALRQQARELGIAGRVEWIPAVKPEQVPGYLRQLDMLVLPSRTTPVWAEQLGRVLVEAMGSGVPVVGSDSGSIPEVIGDSGLVFPEGDGEQLAECLRRLMQPEERQRFVRRGWQKVQSRYTWQRFVDDLHHHYQTLLVS